NANAKTSRKVRQEPVVKHAPPEPFIIGSDLATNRFRVPITSAAVSMVDAALWVTGVPLLTCGLRTRGLLTRGRQTRKLRIIIKKLRRRKAKPKASKQDLKTPSRRFLQHPQSHSISTALESVYRWLVI
ncbi:MAG: hypothetical protein ACRD6X_05460, partial [Pyrinomonadaceae bacterium]